MPQGAVIASRTPVFRPDTIMYVGREERSSGVKTRREKHMWGMETDSPATEDFLN